MIEYLKVISEILQLLKKSSSGNIRANVRLASRKLKRLKRQLKKDGFEPWEIKLYEDLVKEYAKQLEKLMRL